MEQVEGDYLIDRKKYTVAGYSNYDSTEPVRLPFQISYSGSGEREYTAHEMWVTAEISGRSHSSYILQIKS